MIMELQTTKGVLNYNSQHVYFDNHVVNKSALLENVQVISEYLDKIGINWGPAFGTLIGVVRNHDLLLWNPVFDIYILKEEEERFKEILWLLFEVEFYLVRYERRGLYYLCRNGEYIKVFVLHKISSDVRHTGGSDFIHEKYLQNTVKWDFQGVDLNVPQDVDEYLSFRYGKDWVRPAQTKMFKAGIIARFCHGWRTYLQDSLPDSLYFSWLLQHRKRDFLRFKSQCEFAGIPLPKNVQLANMKPRKFKRVFTVGVYDLMHIGHVELYRRAKGLGDYLIVAVQDNEFILKYKPNANVLNHTEDRKNLVKSIRYVDEVITYTNVDEIVKLIEFDVFITGPDQCHAGFKRAIKWCEENGKEHFVLGRTDGISSSDLKRKLINNIKKGV